MVPSPSRFASQAAARSMRLAGSCVLAVLACFVAAASVDAQSNVHYQHAGVLSPGAIGSRQLQRGGPLPGYFQPVEVRAPAGAHVSFADAGRFTDPEPMPAKAALLIGSVYRLRVTGIPRREGEEVYPTIELVNRLYPPVGDELRFPIPIELSQDDLEAALAGKFVTRIVYLENPRAAYALRENPDAQFSLDVEPDEDPLAVADRLGRPMAIVRIGGRTPADVANPTARFLYDSPPLLRFLKRPAAFDPVSLNREVTP